MNIYIYLYTRCYDRDDITSDKVNFRLDIRQKENFVAFSLKFFAYASKLNLQSTKNFKN